MIKVELTKRELREKIFGVVYGTAVGDALGYPVEFMNLEQIYQKHPGGFTDYPKVVPEGFKMVAQYSDDTQMMIATFKGLIRAKTWDDLNYAGELIAAEYVRWSKSPENNRAPGMACMYGCKNLDAGDPWRKAGKPNSKGCGTAMRAMAYGVWHWKDPDKAALWAAQHSLMTHHSKNAMAASAGVAAAVALGIQGYSYLEIFHRVLDVVKRYDDECSLMLSSVFTEWWDSSAKVVLDQFRGWRGDEALAASFWCFAKHYRSFKDGVLCAVHSPGDSDSLGAITGALLGAQLGLKSIAKEYIDCIENKEGLEELANEVKDLVWEGA